MVGYILVCKLLILFAPGEIRTPDHLVRSQILYPAELRAHSVVAEGAILVSSRLKFNHLLRCEDWLFDDDRFCCVRGGVAGRARVGPQGGGVVIAAGGRRFAAEIVDSIDGAADGE